MDVFDTIAAISTPRGKGGVALLRISGSEAISICEKVFFPRSGKKLSELASNCAVYGRICRPGGEELDDGLVTLFRAPRSFTGEDTVEIGCHGGLLLTREVLSALLEAGARAAEAGEFTRRAFINGKMGLSGAEALGELLEADTHAKLALSRGGMKGKLSEATKSLYDRLLEITTGLYAAIDYPEEDLSTLSREEITGRVETMLVETKKLADTYRSGRAVMDGIATVICGKPNVGKSSLFNALVGSEAAIVTEVAGTTRDILHERVSLGRVTLKLYDTAGLRESDDRVEQIGVERAMERLKDAELILAVFDSAREFDSEDRALCRALEEARGKKIALLNKSDGEKKLDESAFSHGFGTVLSVSALTGEGMEKLKEKVEEYFFDGSLDLGSDAVVANARQHASILRASEALEGALAALSSGLGEDICASELEAAMSAFAEIDGRQISEDIVSGIFSHFCVGK